MVARVAATTEIFFFSPTPYRRPRFVGGYPRTVPVEGGTIAPEGGTQRPREKIFFFSRAGRQKPLADRVPAPSVDRVPEVSDREGKKNFFFSRAGRQKSLADRVPARAVDRVPDRGGKKKFFFFPGGQAKNLSPTASRRLRSTGCPRGRARSGNDGNFFFFTHALSPSKVRRGVPEDRTGRRGDDRAGRGSAAPPRKNFFFSRAGRQKPLADRVPAPSVDRVPEVSDREGKKNFFFFPGGQAKITRRPRPGPCGRPGPRPRRKKKFFFFPGGQAKISRRPRPGAFGRPGPRGRARSGNDGNFFFSPTPYRRPRFVGGYPRTVPVEGGDDRAGGGDAAPPRKNFFFSRAGRQKPLADRVPAPSVDRVPEVSDREGKKNFFFSRAGRQKSLADRVPARAVDRVPDRGGKKKFFFFPGGQAKISRRPRPGAFGRPGPRGRARSGNDGNFFFFTHALSPSKVRRGGPQDHSGEMGGRSLGGGPNRVPSKKLKSKST